MLSIRDDWWDPSLSLLPSMPELRCEDCLTFVERVTPSDALDDANDRRWTEQYGDFIPRDRRFYIAGLARHLHNSNRDFARLQYFNTKIAPPLFGIDNPDGRTLSTLVNRLRKWAEREEEEGVFSMDRGLSPDHPNVDCVFFTSKQKLRLLQACRRPVLPGPFDPRHRGSEFP